MGDQDQALTGLEPPAVNGEAPRRPAEAQRRVLGALTMFISNSHVGPDLEIELFLLAPAS